MREILPLAVPVLCLPTLAPDLPAQQGAGTRREALGLPARDANLCARCHPEIVAPRAPGEAFLHKPVAEGRCLDCHRAHASSHKGLLVRGDAALCFRCHEDQAERQKEEFTHTPFRTGECIRCHEPHRGEYEKGLRGEGLNLCGSCHQDKEKVVEEGEWNLHAPFGMGECLLCHDAHAGAGIGNTVAAGSELCSSCHDLEDEGLAAGHMGLPMAGLACLSCHTPHATPNEHMLRKVLHSPFEEQACDMCHDTEGDDPRTLFAEVPELCQTCHDDVSDMPGAASVHAPVREGRCLYCHMPHASEQPSLVRGDGRTLCLSCHQEMRERADRSVAQHLDYPGVQCTSCHAPHVSGQRSLLKGDVIQTCATCHEQHLNFAHPMGEKATDPNTGQPVDCLSCHDPHGTAFTFQLRDDPRRPLCLRCHNTTQ